ncbi:MAG: hypothetical protein JXR97_07755 [Planctomycetes bacterium]|nr:hypothetical protein [Planctomycetota bacterium]
MNKFRFMSALVVALFLCSALTVSNAWSGDKGKGKGKSEKEEKENKKSGKSDKGSDESDEGKGNGKGQKKGWGDSDVPPGIAKQGEEKIGKWKEAKDKGKRQRRERMRKG